MSLGVKAGRFEVKLVITTGWKWAREYRRESCIEAPGGRKKGGLQTERKRCSE